MTAHVEHTFCILAYKFSPYLQDCIASLQSQDNRSTIILCTSTPSPELAEIARTHNIEYKVNTIHKGISGDWNFALRAANTRYVTLAHQDDLYMPTYASTVLRLMQACDDALIGFSDYYELRGDSLCSRSWMLIVKRVLRWPFIFSNTLRSKWFKKLLLLFGSTIPCPAVTYNMNNCAHLQFSSDLEINLDWLAWIDLSRSKGAFVYTSRQLMAHRIHENSETTLGIESKTRAEEDRKLFTMLWGNSLGNVISLIYRLSYRSNKI